MEKLEAYFRRLEARRPSFIDLGLTRVVRTLEALDRPQDRCPPVFHIAGTNGKGSTMAFLRAILEAADYNVHGFISPHLVRPTERIVLAGEEISEDYFIEILERADAAAGDEPLTFFETITCAAFIAYAETPSDFLLLEVGLGGRLDATNVLTRPLASLVAAVDLDHQRFLGETIGEIAREKAGIMRKGAPAVIGAQSAEAMAVLEACAASTGATSFAYGADWTVWPENGRLVYQDDRGLSDLNPPRLTGAHQYLNAGLAIAATRAAGLDLTEEVLSKGLETATWPARLQRLKRGPLLDLIPSADGGDELWLDGGHNPHAARALAAALGELEEKDPKPLLLVAGMQEGKDAKGFFEVFAGLARGVYTVRSTSGLAKEAGDLAMAAMEAGLNAAPCANVESAIREARRVANGPARFLICGSLYLAGDVLKTHA